MYLTNLETAVTTVENAGDSWILAPAPAVDASYRGFEDNGKHDPEEFSIEEDEDDSPGWF